VEVKRLEDLERFASDAMAKINLFETERFFCDIYCFESGQAQKVHSHAANDKIYLVLRGELKVAVGQESSTLRRGEAALAPAGEPHGIANESPERAVCLAFMAPHPSRARSQGRR
jgi:quercetin dioxygenase-like cupin family protein